MGNQKLIELVIAAGADVNLKGSDGKTALQLAKEKGHIEIVELLQKYGAKEEKENR
jgi:ankyrin repeat protein